MGVAILWVVYKNLGSDTKEWYETLETRDVEVKNRIQQNCVIVNKPVKWNQYDPGKELLLH
jgi:hypothetical protein